MNEALNSVWLIDDNEIDNFINKKIIQKTNFAAHVIDFNSATEAEKKIDELLAAKAYKEAPEYVFLDLNMPVYSGTDFMKKCETKLLQLNPAVKVVILTSSINPNDEFITSLFSSFKAFINKPLNAESLAKLSNG